jgi:hypothetical protein
VKRHDLKCPSGILNPRTSFFGTSMKKSWAENCEDNSCTAKSCQKLESRTRYYEKLMREYNIILPPL